VQKSVAPWSNQKVGFAKSARTIFGGNLLPGWQTTERQQPIREYPVEK